MSMSAEFVQVDEAELARIKKDPSWAETLFESGPPIVPPSLAALSQALQDRMRSSGPRLMADVLAQMNPEMRKQMEARLGVTAAALASGEGGDLLVKAMEDRRERLARTMPGMFDSLGSAPPPSREKLSLDKAWHGVHYVLCGEPESGRSLLSQPILGGTEIGDDPEGFSGYGPARYFTVAEVAQLARALNRPELEAEAVQRFDPIEMEDLEIYPGWTASQTESDEKWVMDSFRNLRDFFADAAGKSRAIVTCIV